jgi:DNA-binding beta-propeller fold protein YncE
MEKEIIMSNISIRVIMTALALPLLGALLGGCAATQEVQNRRYFFPKLPERPRYEWLAAYQSENDFPKKGFDAFMDKVVGVADATGFDKPLDIKVTDEQKVYVADTGLRGVVVFDLKNKEVHMVGRGRFSDELVRPTNLALDDQENLYVMDADRKAILVFDKNENLTRQFNFSGEMKSGGGIVFDKAKKLLICADTQGNRVVSLSPEGKVVSSIGTSGDKDGQSNRPSAVAINSKGELIVGDMMNARIQIFDSNGKFLRKFGNRGDSPGEFQLMKGVAVDSEDHIYVSDGKGNKVEVFSDKGDYLITVGSRGSVAQTGKVLPFGFLLPQGIYIDRYDRVYVVDAMNTRFQVIQYLSDDFLKKNPIPGVKVQ